MGGDCLNTGCVPSKALIAAALDWCEAEGAEEVAVVTQGRNVAAQRLYQRCGFVTQRLELWYHKWFLPEEFDGD